MTREIPAIQLMIGLGLVARELERGERPLTHVRQVLDRQGFSNNQINFIFDAIKQGRILGIQVNIRQSGRINYWSLADATAKM